MKESGERRMIVIENGWRMRADSGKMNDDGRAMPAICSVISVNIGTIRPAEAGCRPYRAYLLQEDERKMPEVETEGAVHGAEVEEYDGVPGHGDLQR